MFSYIFVSVAPKYYKYVEKHFVKVKICPYICIFLNRFLKAISGGIRNSTFYDELQIGLSLVAEKNLRTIEGGVPKIIDKMLNAQNFWDALNFQYFQFFLVQPTIMSREKTTSLEYGQIALFQVISEGIENS